MNTRMSSWCIAVAVTLVACGKDPDGKRALPPATGAGSPPLPTLPAVGVVASTPSATVTSVRKSTGTLLPHAEVAVVARSRGIVVALTVDIGARVKKGQVVFRVDDREVELRLTSERARGAPLLLLAHASTIHAPALVPVVAAAGRLFAADQDSDGDEGLSA
jgi:multidrug efflux pump subunit AcrA (membrane-fusion protein)